MPYGGAPFGEGGALHHIGTRGGRAAWSNPHDAGLVVASMSSVYEYGSDPRKLVGRAADGWNSTQNAANSWVAVDLGPERTMRVAHYCLRHGYAYAYLELRSWELQARAGEADDGWNTLRRHDADASLQGGDSVAAFEVTQHTGTAFRHFRLHQHGPNAHGYHHLVCGGLELYGTLLDGATYE